MPDFVLGEIDHHFLTVHTSEEGHLTVGLRNDATVLAALVVELQGCLADGNGLWCSGHDDNGRVLYGDTCSSRERRDAVRLSGGSHLGDIYLHLGANGCCAEYVALDGKRGRPVRRGLVEHELIVVAVSFNRCRHLCVTLIELQGGGFNHALVLCHRKVDARHVVGVHHTRSRHVGIGQGYVLLRGGVGHYAVIVAAGTCNGHVLQFHHLDFGHPTLTFV